MTEQAQTYLRADEISQLLGLSTRTIRRWIADGTLPSVKLGGARLVARATLEQRLGASLDISVGSNNEE